MPRENYHVPAFFFDLPVGHRGGNSPDQLVGHERRRLNRLFFVGSAVAPPLLFARLAPGLLGIYQVDVQVPAQLGADPSFGCTDYLPKITNWDIVSIPIAP